MSKPKRDAPVMLRMSTEVAREIRQHARSNNKTEVCGVLIGSDSDGVTTIDACIAGANASQGGTHVTFTQDTWEHIYKVKDRDYPDERILGWYHSHPGFGVFLSDHDTFIHKNFFSSPQQVAWVYDPHSDEEGCFGWRGERIERMSHFNYVDRRGGEIAGGAERPRTATDHGSEQLLSNSKNNRRSPNDEDSDITQLSNIVFTVFSHLAVLLAGALLVWYLFPHTVYVGVPVDPRTGVPLRLQPDNPSAKPAAPGSPSQEKNQSQPPAAVDSSKLGETTRDDVHR